MPARPRTSLPTTLTNTKHNLPPRRRPRPRRPIPQTHRPHRQHSQHLRPGTARLHTAPNPLERKRLVPHHARPRAQAQRRRRRVPRIQNGRRARRLGLHGLRRAGVRHHGAEPVCHHGPDAARRAHGGTRAEHGRVSGLEFLKRELCGDAGVGVSGLVFCTCCVRTLLICLADLK